MTIILLIMIVMIIIMSFCRRVGKQGEVRRKHSSVTDCTYFLSAITSNHIVDFLYIDNASSPEFFSDFFHDFNIDGGTHRATSDGGTPTAHPSAQAGRTAPHPDSV